MWCRTIRAITLFTLISVPLPLAFAAPKPVKPTVKKPAPRVLLGTKQLSGDQAVPGREYTIGKAWPVNFQLNSAEYSTRRLRIGDRDFLPTAKQKYLILHYTLHNPQKTESLARHDTLRFTAVDSTDTNMEGSFCVGIESTGEAMNLRLKPGQKINGYTFIAVPAAASVPKLIVKSGDNLVLRYDLNGKIKPLSGPCANPDDKTGVTALGEIPAQVGATYEMGTFDVAVVSVSGSTTPIKDRKLKEGESNLVVSMKVKNVSSLQQTLRFDSFQVQLVDADGMNVPWRGNLLVASRDADFNSRVDAGQEVNVRTFVTLAKGQMPKSLSLTSGNDNRKFIYDVSTVQ